MTAPELTTPPTSEVVDGMLGELFLTPEGRQDPYPRYAAIAAGPRIHQSVLGFAVVHRYDDCLSVLRDPRFGRGTGDFDLGIMSADPEAAAAAEYLVGRPASMLQLDPPDHTRIRALVSKAFTPRTVEQMRPHVVRLVDDLLDGFATGAGAVTEVMAELAVPLPVTVIGEMLGMPAEDRATFQPWVRAMTVLLEMTVAPSELAAAADASRHMEAYLSDLLAERRARPQPDLLTELLSVEDAGDTISEGELIATVMLLFGAGFETTSNLIGNGLLALLRSPGELERLRSDRSLLRGAIEELLRYDSPVQIDGRMAFEDVEIAGHLIPAGGFVTTLIGAANRDASHFGDPDRLDVGRDEGPPLSFGSGIHYCLGAALARMEGQVVFDRILDRFAQVELASDELEWRTSLTLRGLAALPVHLG